MILKSEVVPLLERSEYGIPRYENSLRKCVQPPTMRTLIPLGSFLE